jgi:S-formylglutathione hydrolase
VEHIIVYRCLPRYVNEELPAYIEKHFPVCNRKSIMGHSMGGHGAITSFLNHPGKYESVSAFSPICNPSEAPWGRKALEGYLGSDKETWKKYDASRLLHVRAFPPQICKVPVTPTVVVCI